MFERPLQLAKTPELGEEKLAQLVSFAANVQRAILQAQERISCLDPNDSASWEKLCPPKIELAELQSSPFYDDAMQIFFETTSRSELRSAERELLYLWAEIAKNPLLREDVMMGMRRIRYSLVLEGLAQNPNAPAELLLELSGSNFQQVSQNPMFELIVLSQPEFLFRLHYGFIEYLLGLPDCKPAMFSIFSKHESTYIRQQIAENPRTPEGVLSELVSSNEIYVRLSLLKNPKLPPELLEKLSNDQREDVRRTIARDPKTPLQILEKMLVDPEEKVRSGLLSNPETPPHFLEKLANEKKFHNDILEHPRLNAKALSVIAQDNRKAIRERVASHEETSPETLRKLSLDPVWQIRRAVARNPNTPQNLLETLANDEELAVRRAVLETKRIPKESISLAKPKRKKK